MIKQHQYKYPNQLGINRWPLKTYCKAVIAVNFVAEEIEAEQPAGWIQPVHCAPTVEVFFTWVMVM